MNLDMDTLGDISEELVAKLMRIETHRPSSFTDPVIMALLPNLTETEVAARVEMAAKRRMCVVILEAARSVLSILEEGEGDLLRAEADEVDSRCKFAHLGVAGGPPQLCGSACTACHIADRFLQAIIERLHESSPCVGAGGAATPSASDTSVGEVTVERAGSSPDRCCSCERCGSAGAPTTPAETVRIDRGPETEVVERGKAFDEVLQRYINGVFPYEVTAKTVITIHHGRLA